MLLGLWGVLKGKLVELIHQVCLATLDATVSVGISVCGPTDDVNEFPLSITRTHEFMVFLDFSENADLLDGSQKKIASFTGKTICCQRVNEKSWLFWGEGTPVVDAPVNLPSIIPQQLTPPEKNIVWLKTETVLPAWLERELFDVQHARYEPDWKKFESNLNLTEDDLKVYLGTYFPRSYSEAFCVLDNLFENDDYRQNWLKKSDARILDIGSGSGGNLIGLLTVLEKNCPNLKSIDITVIDGSLLALGILESLVGKFRASTKKQIQLSTLHRQINSISDLPEIGNNQFDYISSFKMGCEIISNGKGKSDQTYYDLLAKYTPALTTMGLMFLLDVTTKSAHTGFYPEMMNRQVCEFIKAHNNFSTLIPIPCHLNEYKCSEGCFTQKEFRVSHKLVTSDRSLVAYRLVGHRDFVERIHQAPAEADYVIARKKGKGVWTTCCTQEGNATVLDAYKMNYS